jgi:hypothetical protein
MADFLDPGVLPVNGEYLHERLPHNKHSPLAQRSLCGDP